MKTCVTGIILILLAVGIIPVSVLANTATIEKVIQGDRIQIKGWEVVRLTGITVPKLEEPCGREAFELTKQELEGKLVVIATYTTDGTAAGIVRDAEGLCMVNIEYGGETRSKGEIAEGESKAVDFNALMLEKGLARVDEKYLPDHLQHYRELEKTAQENKIGIWQKE